MSPSTGLNRRGTTSAVSRPTDFDGMNAHDTIDSTFRHEHGKLVAVLTRAFGTQHLEAIEDAVQEALAAALSSWGQGGAPRSPSAWLQQVARNKLIDSLRKNGSQRLTALPDAVATQGEPVAPPLAGELRGDLLRVLFLCCEETLQRESQIALALKLLCGFTTSEIARRLFTSEANVYKRLQRGRERLQARGRPQDLPHLASLKARSQNVRQIIYLLFNEGYSSARAAEPLRQELCEEAIYLATLLSQHPVGDDPETWALLALMHFHAARAQSRTDGAGGLLLLEEQDRRLWDKERIQAAFVFLNRAARGQVFSRFHAEAGIAAEHCMAPSFEQTRWSEIVTLYETLERYEPSPLFAMNRAIAVAQVDGPKAGLKILHALKPPGWLTGYYLWDAVMGELERKVGNRDRARQHLERALEAAPTDAEKALMKRRLSSV